MNVLNRKIPTLLGLAVLIAGIGLAVFVMNNTTSFQGEAAADDEPKNIRITNIGSNSFSISFVTDTDVLASVRYGTSETDLSQTAVEGNDTQKSHLITLNNLSASSSYYFMIISGAHEYSDNGSPFVSSTGPVPSGEKASMREVTGTVLNPDGSPSSKALVYLSSTGANIISTMTNSDGVFSLDASSLLTSDFSSYLQISDETVLNLSAANNGQELAATFFAASANPLPTTTLGQAYNFTISDMPETSASAPEIGFPVFRQSATEERTVSIDTPEANEAFTDQQPNFEGTALPNETVEITIQSSHEIATSVTANSNGAWQYRPESPLEPGEHVITIKTRDANGIIRTLTRPFTVYAQGSQFTEPSVSPQAPTITATPTITLSPTSAPTAALEASPTIAEPTSTIVPTQTPVPSQITPTPVPQVDPTGPANIPLAIVSSVTILLSGAFIYFLAKMNSI